MGNGFDMNGFMQGFQNFMQNRGQILGENNVNDPNAIIQNMMNSGRFSQQQYNAAQNIARQIQNMYHK